MRFTRIHYTVLALLAVAFGAITVVKFVPFAEVSPSAERQDNTDRHEQVRQFWRRYNQATRYRTSGEPEAAAAEYRQALKLDPDHEDALYYLGNVYAELGQLAPAETTWIRLTSVNPSSARAYVQLGDLHFCADTAAFFDIVQARGAYAQALAIHNEETRPLLRLAEIALVREQWDEAHRHIDAVSGSNYQSAAAYLLKGYLAWQQGDDQQASAQLATAMRYAQKASSLELSEEGGGGQEGSRSGERGASRSTRPLDCPLDASLHALRQRSASENTATDAYYEQVADVLGQLRQRMGDGHAVQ